MSSRTYASAPPEALLATAIESLLAVVVAPRLASWLSEYPAVAWTIVAVLVLVLSFAA